VNYYNLLVVTITVTCYSWAPYSGDHLFSFGDISRPPHFTRVGMKIHPKGDAVILNKLMHCTFFMGQQLLSFMEG